jgi:hypothetical protein
MATKRKSYVKVRIGTADDLVRRGIRGKAFELYWQLKTHPGRRAIPGLVPSGAAGLAENIAGQYTPTLMKRCLAELAAADLIVMDTTARPQLIYVLDSAADDPPVTRQSIAAMARQLVDLPRDSSVTIAVRREIEAALMQIDPKGRGDTSEYANLLDQWRAALRDAGPGSHPDSGSPSHPEMGSGPRAEPASEPAPLLLSTIPSTQPPTSAVATNAREAAAVDSFLEMFTTRFRERRGRNYRPRDGERQKACELVEAYTAEQLARMTDLLLGLDQHDRDTWLADTDRSISVLHHRADQLLRRAPGRATTDDPSKPIFDALRNSVADRNSFNVRIAPLRFLRTDGNHIVLLAPNELAAKLVLKHHAHDIDAAVALVAPGRTVRIVTDALAEAV